MARVFIEGFESGGLESMTAYYPGMTAAAVGTTGMSGDYMANIDYDRWGYWTLPSTYAEIYVALRITPFSASSDAILAFMDTATLIGCLGRNASTGRLYVTVGATVVANGTAVLADDCLHHIEIRYKIDDSGVIQVKVDGVLDIDYSGDTKVTSTTLNILRLGFGAGVPGTTASFYIDDVIVDTAAWIGNSKIQAIIPNAVDNTYKDWTPNTAVDNYTCVDERPASDTDYISSNTSSHLDLYACSNLTGTIDTVKTVQVQARCAYEGSPTPTRIQLALRSSSTNYFSASLVTPAAFGMPVRNIWETDPAGGAWDETKVNALEIGVKAVSS
jgi:hypothetical protein